MSLWKDELIFRKKDSKFQDIYLSWIIYNNKTINSQTWVKRYNAN